MFNMSTPVWLVSHPLVVWRLNRMHTLVSTDTPPSSYQTSITQHETRSPKSDQQKQQMYTTRMV